MELRRGNRSLNNRRFVLTRDRVISRSRGIVAFADFRSWHL
jgi:hypothetical protein